MIVFAPGITSPLMKVAANGGTVTPATTLVNDTSHRFPSFLPDARHFLFFSDPRGILIGSLESATTAKSLAPSDATAKYVSPGYLLLWRGGFIVAQRFDAKHLKLEGAAVPIADGVASARGLGVFTASNDGTLVYEQRASGANTQLVWVDRSGKDIGVVAPKGEFYSPRLSHDQRRIAVDRSESGAGDIWVFDLERNVSTRLTYNPANESSPVWSADDKTIYFFRDTKHGNVVLQIPAGGTGDATALFAQQGQGLSTSDANRDWLVMTRLAANSEVLVYSFASRTLTPLLTAPFQESCGALSPDGKWMAYQSDESGRMEIYVRSFPRGDQKWLISTDGGDSPAWRGDGREIFYIAKGREMTAVPISYEPQFDAGTPVRLFDAVLRKVVPVRQYDISPDGKRFLLNRQSEQDTIQPLTIVQNWSERLPHR